MGQSGTNNSPVINGTITPDLNGHTPSMLFINKWALYWLQLGGPNWDVKLGRRDAKTTSLAAANKGIPAPTSNLNTLISRFNNLGLSTKDLVALAGNNILCFQQNVCD